ncbi:hypothetical protein Bpfe_018099, partial [Biomphalaria pfeifferi]
MITINQLSVVISQVTRTCLTLRIEEANAHQILTGNHDEFLPEKGEIHLSPIASPSHRLKGEKKIYSMSCSEDYGKRLKGEK